MIQQRAWHRSWPTYLPRDLEISPVPLHSFLTESASRLPNKTCIVYQGRTFTYSGLDDLSSRFASALVALGLRKGDRVGVFMPNMPQFIISYFGILKAGGVVVACSPLYKEKELEFQLRDSGSSLVIAVNDVVRGNDLYKSLEACRGRVGLRHVITASLTDYLPALKRNLAGIAGVKNLPREDTIRFTDLIRAHGPLEGFPEVDPMNDLAVLQYTGGTTGTSKGAMLTHYNLYANAMMAAAALPLTEEDVCLSVLPLFHIYGMTVTMNAPVFVGAKIVLLPRFEVKQVMETIQKERVTCFCAVPTMYIAVINSEEGKRFDLRTVRACISGGAPLAVAVRKKFIEMTGGNLVEGYGLTECSPVTHINPLKDALPKEASIGIPLPATDAAIVDLDDPERFLPTGEVGELAIRGPQVMKGYWNRKEESEMVLRNGWLLTGDIAKMDDDGYFYIVDRKKDMVDVGGFKVYPREVEEILFEHPEVKDAAAIGIVDSYRGEAVKAFVVLKDPTKKVSEAEIIQFCTERVAKYKVPKQVEFVGELPKTLVGKVLRRKLREATSRQS
ncbi:MAG: long-chain fatty acid--CoA ligase [Thaumarchaeota archaeon]|nr:MAG: long-chain fatty acid--CoA ligase [Nitrososphaerota archaeon]